MNRNSPGVTLPVNEPMPILDCTTAIKATLEIRVLPAVD
jgi:hypothetical protein